MCQLVNSVKLYCLTIHAMSCSGLKQLSLPAYSWSLLIVTAGSKVAMTMSISVNKQILAYFLFLCYPTTNDSIVLLIRGLVSETQLRYVLRSNYIAILFFRFYYIRPFFSNLKVLRLKRVFFQQSLEIK